MFKKSTHRNKSHTTSSIANLQVRGDRRKNILKKCYKRRLKQKENSTSEKVSVT